MSEKAAVVIARAAIATARAWDSIARLAATIVVAAGAALFAEISIGRLRTAAAIVKGRSVQ